MTGGSSGGALSGAANFPVVYRDDAASGARLLMGPDADRDLVFLSPTGEHVAVSAAPTAVDPGSVTILETDTGREVESVQYEGQGLYYLTWSDDGSAVRFQDATTTYVHRIGGGTAEVPGSFNSASYSSGGTSIAAVLCGGESAVVVSVDGDAAPQMLGNEDVDCDLTVQAQTSNGELVALASTFSNIDSKVILYRVQPDAGVEVVDTSTLDPAFSLTVDGGTSTRCEGSVVGLDEASGLENINAIYDVTTGVITRVPPTRECPIPSPSHSRYAMRTSDGGVVSVEAGSGAIVEVAKTGLPIAWSKDDRTLLVEGGGTFLVQADGSGGEPASVTIEVAAGSAYTFGGLYCRAGETGMAVLMTPEGPVLFDVATNTAIPLPDAILGPYCWMTPDERWLVSGFLAVDLQKGVGISLPGADPRLVENYEDPGYNYLEHRWVGLQTVVQAVQKLAG